MPQEEELCLFGSTCSRTSLYGLERTPRDTHIQELLPQVARISDPVLNPGCGQLQRAGMLEPPCSANAFPCVVRPQSQLCLRKEALEMSQAVSTGTLILSPSFK